MKRLDFIVPIILGLAVASCGKSTKGSSCATSKSGKHQKMQTFVAPPPQIQEKATDKTAESTENKHSAYTYEKNLVVDTSAHFEISQYAYYTPTDSNQRQVRPELIEKYRRARNNSVYINKYPTDWAGIMKDRGMKPAKEKKSRVKKQRTQNYYPSYYGSNWYGQSYRPRGWGLFPILSYGWNSTTGWSPNVGVVVGPRSGWGPYGAATWNGRNRGMNYNMGMPMYYNNVYQQPYLYPGNMYGNTYYNNVYHYNSPSPAPQAVIQSNADTPTSGPSSQPKDTATQTPKTTTDWSDGVGGPDKYTSKSKKISDYEVK